MLSLNVFPSSSSIPFTKPNHHFSINAPHTLKPNLLNRFHHESHLKKTNLSLTPTSQIHRSTTKLASFNGFFSYPFEFSPFSPKPRNQILKAVSDEGEVSPPSTTPKPKNLKKLALVFGFWYFQNIVFNIYNKKVLNIFSFPWLLASFQLFVGSIWMLVLWSLKLQPCPKISKPFIFALLGPALFHTIGHISACVSFSKVAVSFNIQGLWCALISNVGFVLRNIYSKKSLQNFKEVDGLNLYGWITILSFLYLFPVAIFVEGSQWIPGYYKAIEAIGKPSILYVWVLVSGVFYHLYNQSSYQALDEISPLTFSVGNTMKRVVVIVSSVLVFRNPVRPLNGLGSAIAILGTFLYSQATAAKKAKKIEGEKSS
ncbi:unnamed protein product [Lathyrus oleraceus]